MPGFSSITSDEAIMYADNASFDGTQRGGKMTTNGQIWIGSTIPPHVKLGTLTSPLGTLTIGYAGPNITLDITGGGLATEKFAVDTTTGGGTNPVLPNGSNTVTVTGGQYATGTFGTRVITVNSPAANTFAVEVQISSTAGVSTSTKNGVCHFDSADFTVDGNGFVSASSTGFIKTLTGTTGGARPPTANNINLLAATVAAGSTPIAIAGSASTLTTNVQISQAIASTDATKIGLAAFNSADFTVDANGFVSTIAPASSFTYLSTNHAGSPYTVVTSTTQTFVSVDPSAGTVSILLPNAPTTNYIFTVKDRTGSASTNNISVTTVGGSVTLDGQTTYTIDSNYAAINLLFNGTSYEVF